ncbi:hypothetical protein E4V51_13565 [Paenibacillus sp. 28ISP30-2]|nr:hypothetical protein [Paenibacillus sp. 28ISP30-2]
MVRVVAPYVGAWIEMVYMKLAAVHQPFVASYVGAWIEMPFDAELGNRSLGSLSLCKSVN